MDNTDNKIERIEEISEGLKPKEVERQVEETSRTPANKEHFDSLMNLEQQRAPTVVRTSASENISLMDQIREIHNKVEGVSRASPTELVAQAQGVIKQIEEVKTQLATPSLEIKGSVQSLLKNKLSHIDESLKVALNRAGMEYTPQEALAPKTTLVSPIERFLGFLTHGQYQLQRLSQDIEMMQNTDNHLTPANMLAIQMKVGYIQQEVELFANMLNKSLESIKTIMNVQI